MCSVSSRNQRLAYLSIPLPDPSIRQIPCKSSFWCFVYCLYSYSDRVLRGLESLAYRSEVCHGFAWHNSEPGFGSQESLFTTFTRAGKYYIEEFNYVTASAAQPGHGWVYYARSVMWLQMRGKRMADEVYRV